MNKTDQVNENVYQLHQEKRDLIRRWGRAGGITLAVVFSLAIIVLVFFNATISTANWFDETGISNGVGECHYLDGDYIVMFDGTFDGATVSLQSAVRTTTANDKCATADRMIDVNVSALVGVVAETSFIGVIQGAGFYQIEVVGGSGSEQINGHFRKANRR